MKYLNTEEARIKFPESIFEGIYHISEYSHVSISLVYNSNVYISNVSISVVSDSNVSNSRVIGSRVSNSEVSDSVVYNSLVYNSRVSDSLVSNSNVYNSNLENRTIKNSEIREGYEGIVVVGMYKYKGDIYFNFRCKKIIIGLGCHHRTIEEWEQEGKLGFDNNLEEFPKGSPEYLRRKETYEYLKSWGLQNLNPTKEELGE